MSMTDERLEHWRKYETYEGLMKAELLARIDEQAAELKELRGDERDCYEVANEIADAVECYEGDDLLGQIVPSIQPLMGRLDALRAEVKRLTAENQRLRERLAAIVAADKECDRAYREGTPRDEAAAMLAVSMEILAAARELEGNNATT